MSDGSRDGMNIPITTTLPAEHPCATCSACCTYVAVPLDEPEDIDDYDGIIWYLLHRHVRIYIDHDGDWYVEFSTPCTNLSPDGLCTDYERRPILCEEYNASECMRSDPDDSGEERAFENAQEFLAYLKEEGVKYEPRKVAARRLKRKRRN